MKKIVSDILNPDHKVVVSSQDLELADKWVQCSNPKQAIEYLASCNVENIIVGGGRQLATRLRTLENNRLEIRPGRIDRSSHSRWSRAQDDDFSNILRHVDIISFHPDLKPS